MSDKLQQAIQATRAGDAKNAQFLLTQAIQENPDNPQAWYLLSLLVDDREKKQAYLTKVLDLDPDHAKAHQQFLAMSETAVPESAIEEPEPEPIAVPLSSGSGDLGAQDDGETLPDWMADDLPSIDDPSTEPAVETKTITEEPVPDWLEDEVEADWDQEKDETAVADVSPTESTDKENEQPTETEAEKKEVTPVAKKPTKAEKEQSEKQLNYMLIGLIVIAIIIFFVMAYMIFTM